MLLKNVLKDYYNAIRNKYLQSRSHVRNNLLCLALVIIGFFFAQSSSIG